MKRSILVWPLLFTMIVLYAQHDPFARQILDAVSKKYSEMESMHIHFTFTSEHGGASDQKKGEAIVKGNKYWIKLGSQEIYNNGTTVWTYMPESKEVNITKAEDGEDIFNPAKVIKTLKSGYKYKYIEDKMISGVTYEVVELIPEDIRSKYFKIRLEISKKENLIHYWQVFERNGNKHSWSVSSFNANHKVEDSHFNFDKSRCPDCTYVDLRN